MMFRPALARAVMLGEKTVTRRACSSNPRSPWYRERCSLKPGQVVAVQPGRGLPRIGNATVHGVARELFNPSLITWAEAMREGFRNHYSDEGIAISGEYAHDNFRATWLALHGDLDPVEVWRIELDVYPHPLAPVRDPSVERLAAFYRAEQWCEWTAWVIPTLVDDPPPHPSHGSASSLEHRVPMELLP